MKNTYLFFYLFKKIITVNNILTIAFNVEKHVYKNVFVYLNCIYTME